MCTETRTIHSLPGCKHTIRRLRPCRRATEPAILCPRYTIECQSRKELCPQCSPQRPEKRLSKQRESVSNRKSNSYAGSGKEAGSYFDEEWEGGCGCVEGLRKWWTSLIARGKGGKGEKRNVKKQGGGMRNEVQRRREDTSQDAEKTRDEGEYQPRETRDNFQSRREDTSQEVDEERDEGQNQPSRENGNSVEYCEITIEWTIIRTS